jgi:hypothetical protein
MAMTMSGTTLTFNDSTTQTTAAGGAPAHLAIGHVGIFLHTLNSQTLPGNTQSGGYLYKLTSGTPVQQNLGAVHFFQGHAVNSTASTLNYAYNTGTFSNSAGTWRYVSATTYVVAVNTVDNYGNALTSTYPYLWQRIS